MQYQSQYLEYRSLMPYLYYAKVKLILNKFTMRISNWSLSIFSLCRNFRKYPYFRHTINLIYVSMGTAAPPAITDVSPGVIGELRAVWFKSSICKLPTKFLASPSVYPSIGVRGSWKSGYGKWEKAYRKCRMQNAHASVQITQRERELRAKLRTGPATH